MYRRISFKIAQLVVALGILASFLVIAPQATHAATNQVVFNGQMAVTAQLVDVYGQPAGVQTYRTNVQVVASAPQPGETNPFNLTIQSTPLVNNPGELSFYSSLPFEGVTFQYWNYSWTNNTTFQGTLTNNHAAEAIAANLVTLPTEIAPNLTMPYTKAMANGTQMVGVIGADNSLHIVIAGNTTDMSNPFRAEIVAFLPQGATELQRQ